MDIIMNVETVHGKSITSGNSSADEYKRTIGALFGVYWLMRLDLPSVTDSDGLDGQQGFCFGVDPDSWVPLDEPPNDQKTASKRENFFDNQDWKGFHQLMVDSGMLKAQPDGSVQVDAARTAAMLALTAIHDIMKLSELLPRLLPEHAPYHGYSAEDEISDHDVALGYILEHDANAIPCYEQLEDFQRAPVRFTQAKIGFNHGWLVQAEAPPGALFNTFKSVIDSGGIDDSMIACYFVHWLTDLGGAVPTPLNGVEKFVVQFPLAVLESFIQSFPLVQRLANTSQTALMEDYLRKWWPMYLGPKPKGYDAIAKMRLVVQAQSKELKQEVLDSFDRLVPTKQAILAVEMARTGIVEQVYSASPHPGGPAFLVYYSPAFLRQSIESVQLALSILAEVYQAARYLFPLSFDPVEAGKSVTIRIDQLKGCGDARSVLASCSEGSTWVLMKKNDQEAAVESLTLSELCDLLAAKCPSAYQILSLTSSSPPVATASTNTATRPGSPNSRLSAVDARIVHAVGRIQLGRQSRVL